MQSAEILGLKLVLNELVAFRRLSDGTKFRNNLIGPRMNQKTGQLSYVNERTEMILTYALCSFANIGSIGIQLGGLGRYIA